MKEHVQVPRWVYEVLTGRGSVWSHGLLMGLLYRSDFALHRIHARDLVEVPPFEGRRDWSKRRINNGKRALLRAGVIVPAPSGEPNLYRLNWDAATGRPLTQDLQWAWQQARDRFEDPLEEEMA